MKRGQDELKKRQDLEEKIIQLNRTVPSSSPSLYHQRVTTLNPSLKSICESAIMAETSIKTLLQSNVSMETLEAADMSGLLKEWPHCNTGQPDKPCDPAMRFRTLQGNCNNLKTPVWGSVLQPFRRILPPSYDDQFSSPRIRNVDGEPLPPARSISLSFQNVTTMAYENRLSMLFLSWGQFLDHDLTATATNKAPESTAIPCCEQSEVHPECFPITIPENDKFYRDKGVQCMDFVRSAAAPQCKIGQLIDLFIFCCSNHSFSCILSGY